MDEYVRSTERIIMDHPQSAPDMPRGVQVIAVFLTSVISAGFLMSVGDMIFG